MLQACFFAVLFILLPMCEASTSLIRPKGLSSTDDYWRRARNMTSARMFHRSTFINGMNIVLITGGSSLPSIDVFFASNGSIIHQGDMTTTRYDHSTDLLPHGLLLIAGSTVSFNTPNFTHSNDGCVADLYDSRSGMVKRTVKMSACRFRHTSSMIQSNHSTKVLLAGGYDGSWLASGDVFHVTTGTFHPVNNSMTEPREFHTATALPNGHVIIAGGCRNDGDCLDTLILYNSRLNRFIPLSARMSAKRAFHTATYIPSIETILFVSSGTFDLFDVPTLTFIGNGTTLQDRQDHTATLLLDGRVLFTGGSHDYGMTSCEIYNPLTNRFTQAANMSVGRYWHTATLIPRTGAVLVCGGRNLEDIFNSCELYSP